MKIRIENVQGLGRDAKLHDELNKSKLYDISLLQEVKLGKKMEQEIRIKLRNHEGVFLASRTTGNGSSRGVLSIFSSRFNIQHLDNKKDEHGQFLINVIRYGHQNLLIGNYYGNPDTDREALETAESFSTEVERMKRKFRIDEIVIGGDFNCVLHQDDTNMTRSKPRTEARWAQIVEDQDLFDVQPILHRTVKHTYFRHRRENSSARFDRFYVTRGMLIDAKIKMKKRMSDHTPVMLEVWKKERKQARWGVDDRRLQEVGVNEMILKAIADVLRPILDDHEEEIEVKQLQYEIDYEENCPVDLLEKVMMTIRRKLKNEGWERKLEYDRIEKERIDEFLEAREKMNQNNNEENRGIYEEKREKLRLMQEKRVKSAHERNYAQYSRSGERMTGYHFSIMNKGKASREIRKLKVWENGVERMVSDNEEIARRMAEKFAKIARPRGDDEEVMSIEEYLGEVLVGGVKKCPEAMREELERPFTETEVAKVISGMKKVSAPGPKGISNKLMKVLQPMLGHLITVAGNKLLQDNNFTGTARWIFKRTVVFILKPGKDPEDEDSYRGLSMLENTFKIYAKILADRLAKVLRDIQDPYQYGFTEGKSCPEPTRTIIDVMRWAVEKREPLLILSTDLFKAFDSIDHNHMENCLRFYGFPDGFTERCMKMVRNGVMEFEVNGQLSEEFKLERGTGQGDPKSCYMYNLAVLPMNEYLSKSPEVPVYEVAHQRINPVYFADDMLMMLKGDQINGIKHTLEKIAEFQKVSGLKLNLKKCEVMAVNCNEREIAQLVADTQMKHVTQMKHLGVIIDDHGRVGEDQNIQPIIDKMVQIAEQYRTSGSTPIGRSLYATFLCCQRYVHRLQNTVLTEQTKKDINSAVQAMVWTKGRYAEEQGGYRAHIAMKRLKQPCQYGGLGVPDPSIQSVTIRMGWLKKFREEYRNEGWFIVLSRWLEEIDRPKIEEHMKMGVTEWKRTEEKMRIKSKYWADVFAAGAEIQKLTIKQKKEWHMIPIMGSNEGQNQIMQNTLEFRNQAARRIVSSGLWVVGQLFHVNDRGQIDPRRMKTYQEIDAQYNCMSILMWNSLVTQVQEIKRRYRQQVENVPVMATQVTPLEAIVKKYAKGNSAANKLFLKADREEWAQGEVPPSYATYVRDGITQIDSGEFMQAFVKIRKSELMASFQWTSTQVLLRTLWTKVKELKARPFAQNGDDRCVNCGQAAEHTVHMLYECTLTQGVIDHVARMINQGMENEIDLTSDVVLFHVKPEGISNELQKDLTDILLIVKHVIYRLRFRENLNVMPVVKAVIIEVILELEKFDRISDSTLQEYIDILRQQIRWFY